MSEDSIEGQVHIARQVSCLSFVLPFLLRRGADYWDAVFQDELSQFLTPESERAPEDEPTGFEALHLYYGGEALALTLNQLTNLELELTESVLDVGTGNGFFCQLLALSGYSRVHLI